MRILGHRTIARLYVTNVQLNLMHGWQVHSMVMLWTCFLIIASSLVPPVPGPVCPSVSCRVPRRSAQACTSCSYHAPNSQQSSAFRQPQVCGVRWYGSDMNGWGRGGVRVVYTWWSTWVLQSDLTGRLTGSRCVCLSVRECKIQRLTVWLWDSQWPWQSTITFARHTHIY